MNSSLIRRGNHVLSWTSRTTGVGHVEGMSYAPIGAPADIAPAHVVRWADGSVDSWPTARPMLVAVEPGTRVIEDQHNNLGRHCSVDATSGRRWEVEAAVSGSRYLVVNIDTDEARIVDHFRMTNLY